MEEKRQLKRRHILFYLRVFDDSNDNLLGFLADITKEGIMLISEKAIKVNNVYRLRMTLPTRIGTKTHLVFSAVSRHCKPDINPDYFDTGFHIKDMKKDDIDLIEYLVKNFGFRD